MPEYIGSVHVAMVGGLPMTIVETKAFVSGSRTIFTDEELADAEMHLALYPESGTVIQDTGGIRKIRFGAKGKGKSGGARVIYFYFNREMPLYLLAIYAKGEKIDLSAQEKRLMKKIVDQFVNRHDDRGVYSSGWGYCSPGVWCDHPG